MIHLKKYLFLILKKNTQSQIRLVSLFYGFVFFFFYFPFQVSLCAKENLTSLSYQFKNLHNHKIILEKSKQTSLPIASINKLFTYFIVRDHFHPKEEILVPNIRLIFHERESRAGIKPNEVYLFSDLILGLLIPSGNDVARVLEYKLKEKNLNYPKLAQAWLKKNQFYNTNIEEPIGLSSQTTSTVNDLWKLLEMVYQNKQVIQALMHETYTIYSLSKKPIVLKNRNHLMKYKTYKIFGKTGSTKKAGFCFLGFIQNLNSPKEIFGIVFLGASDLEKELIAFINLLE